MWKPAHADVEAETAPLSCGAPYKWEVYPSTDAMFGEMGPYTKNLLNVGIMSNKEACQVGRSSNNMRTTTVQETAPREKEGGGGGEEGRVGG